jgi:thiamine-phosphate pyrophosphorylase
MKSYLITDPKYYSNNPSFFKKTLINILQNKNIDYTCFRDKNSSNFEELAKIFCDTCKTLNVEKYFINSDFKLAKKLNATGVHLTSTQFEHISEAKALGLEVIISTHNEREIELAILNGADMITYSPIFETPNKSQAKGIKDLENICTKYPIPILALGGIINDFQVKEILKTSAIGFASIRYFII